MKNDVLVFLFALVWIVGMSLISTLVPAIKHSDIYPPVTPSNKTYVDGSVCDRIHCPW